MSLEGRDRRFGSLAVRSCIQRVCHLARRQAASLSEESWRSCGLSFGPSVLQLYDSVEETVQRNANPVKQLGPTTPIVPDSLRSFVGSQERQLDLPCILPDDGTWG